MLPVTCVHGRAIADQRHCPQRVDNAGVTRSSGITGRCVWARNAWRRRLLAREPAGRLLEDGYVDRGRRGNWRALIGCLIRSLVVSLIVARLRRRPHSTRHLPAMVITASWAPAAVKVAVALEAVHAAVFFHAGKERGLRHVDDRLDRGSLLDTHCAGGLLGIDLLLEGVADGRIDGRFVIAQRRCQR